MGRRLTPQHLARREAARRYPILLTLIAQSAVDVLDESLLLFDQALSGRESAARARLTEVLDGDSASDSFGNTLTISVPASAKLASS